jgi:hypothetical protein
MEIINDTVLECNKYLKINFNGGDLSSDSGLLLIKEFISKIGIDTLIHRIFPTNDSARKRKHKDGENLLQMMFQQFAGYFADDCADELTDDPVYTAILEKDALASQPTLSRFFNRMDKGTLEQLNDINRELRGIAYSIVPPGRVLFDLDTTLLETHGKQEGGEFNFHYQSDGYHPHLCYDGLTGDLLRAELRRGADHCGKGVCDFMRPLIDEYLGRYPGIDLFLPRNEVAC